jgi:hypothetical protein
MLRLTTSRRTTPYTHANVAGRLIEVLMDHGVLSQPIAASLTR